MATATNSNSSAASIEKAVAGKQRFQAQKGPGYFTGTRVLKQTIALAVADLDAADSTPILVFPPRAYLLGLRVKLTDVDGGAGAPTFDVKSGSTVLISESTIGLAGGSDEMDLDIDPTLLDVAGQTLSYAQVVAPTTPAAGTLTVYATVNFDGVIDTW